MSGCRGRAGHIPPPKPSFRPDWLTRNDGDMWENRDFSFGHDECKEPLGHQGLVDRMQLGI